VTPYAETMNDAFAGCTQYTVLKDGNYLPCPPTVPTLPAGMYATVRSKEFDRVISSLHPLGSWMSDKLVLFSDSDQESVLNEINHFWTLQGDYEKFNLVFKRGYLLCGEPGSGKTGLINLVATRVIEDDGVVWYSDDLPALLDLLPKFRSVEPHRKLLVIMEDIDVMLRTYGGDIETKILATLDGELVTNNTVYVATTNYPELLDKRLYNRPGRFDRVVRVKLPSASIREQYLKFKGVPLVVNNVNLVEESHGLSLGHLRELVAAVFIHKEDPRSAVERLKSMKIVPKTSGEPSLGFGHPLGDQN